MTDAYIYDAIRTPRGKGRKDGSAARGHRRAALGLHAQHPEGAQQSRRPRGRGRDLGQRHAGGRTGRLPGADGRSGLGSRRAIPGLAINRFCASGLEAVNLGRQPGAGGAGDAYIAGGVEMMGRVAMGSDGAAIAVDPSIAMETYFVPQGISADIIATEYGFPAMTPTRWPWKARSARQGGLGGNRFAKSVVPVKDVNGLTILDHDEYMRPGTDMQSAWRAEARPSRTWARQMPGFDAIALMKYPHLEAINHIHHAGNSSGIVDGAAALLIGNKEFGERTG
jgi:acetyl-CoA C-acetyltransferase